MIWYNDVSREIAVDMYDHGVRKAQTLNVKEKRLHFETSRSDSRSMSRVSVSARSLEPKGQGICYSYLPRVADFKSSGCLVVAGLPTE